MNLIMARTRLARLSTSGHLSALLLIATIGLFWGATGQRCASF